MFVYRWFDPVDNDVHYSEIAPQNLPYEMIAIANAPPVDLDVQRRLAEMDQHTDERIEARKQRREEVRLAAAAAAARKVDCARVRDWQARLESRPGPKILAIDAEGNARRMTEAERQEKLAAVRQQISTLCTTGR